MINLDQTLLTTVLTIAQQAGEKILEIYHQSEALEVNTKKDDSPVTAADLAAHKQIVSGLVKAFPEIPVLSEESASITFDERSQWSAYWLVDPLDGTKEFINRTGEFTVNIALIQQHKPVLGVVTVPLQSKAYLGAKDLGAFKVSGDMAVENWQPIKVRKLSRDSVVVVGSRRHGAETMAKLMAGLEQAFNQVEMTSMGSSLKFCLLAEGKADLYPRLAPTSEWDTGAAQAVLEAAGGKVVNTDFEPLQYNRKDSLLNPHFISLADMEIDWSGLIKPYL